MVYEADTVYCRESEILCGPYAKYFEQKEINKIEDLQEQLTEQRNLDWAKETEIAVRRNRSAVRSIFV